MSRSLRTGTSSKIFVLHNPRNSDHTIPHPNTRRGGTGAGVTVPAHGRVVFDWDEEDAELFRKSYDLRRSVDQGYVVIEEYDDAGDIPTPLQVPGNLRLSDHMDENTVRNIVYHDDDGLVFEIVNMDPHFRDSSRIDVEYLRTRHAPILRQARWLLENGAGHTERLDQVNARLARIDQM